MTSNGATRQLDLVGEGWSPFAAVADLALDQLDHVTPAGWTVKEMLAHISFWEETVKPASSAGFGAKRMSPSKAGTAARTSA